MRIFERTTEDDFDTLRDLGLLEHVDPRAGTHVPTAAPESVAALLDAVRTQPKRPFHHGTAPAEVEKILSRAAAYASPVPDEQAVAEQGGQGTLPLGGVVPGQVEAVPSGTAPSASRTTAISRPRHCRSVPAQVCALRGGPSYAG